MLVEATGLERSKVGSAESGLALAAADASKYLGSMTTAEIWKTNVGKALTSIFMANSFGDFPTTPLILGVSIFLGASFISSGSSSSAVNDARSLEG